LFGVLPQAGLLCVMEALEKEVKLNESSLESLYSLSWEMLSEMHRAGITIGSHTKTHAILTKESQPKVLEELTGSRQQLEKRLGVAIQHIAYTDGQFDTKTLSAVAASGYRFGYTTCHHRNPRYPVLTIPRHILWETSCMDVLGRFSSSMMNCHVNGVFKLIDRCRDNHGT
ncbi:MAG TPA: polysaccharide deacetylase family protein, partial [Nitrospiria bacterium]|nr:polysaccharide deacetylase family protein [Nitrospiria bacterium]